MIELVLSGWSACWRACIDELASNGRRPTCTL